MHREEFQILSTERMEFRYCCRRNQSGVVLLVQNSKIQIFKTTLRFFVSTTTQNTISVERSNYQLQKWYQLHKCSRQAQNHLKKSKKERELQKKSTAYRTIRRCGCTALLGMLVVQVQYHHRPHRNLRMFQWFYREK